MIRNYIDLKKKNFCIIFNFYSVERNGENITQTSNFDNNIVIVLCGIIHFGIDKRGNGK